MEPPTQAPNRLSTVPLAAIIFSFMDPGVRDWRSRLRRSLNPYNKMNHTKVSLKLFFEKQKLLETFSIFTE